MRELVDEHEAQPVVRVELQPGGRSRVDDNRVVGKRCRVSVREVGLVGQYDVRQRRRPDAQRLRKGPPGILRDGRQPQGQVVGVLMEVDAEVLCSKHSKSEGGIESGCRIGDCRARRRQANEQRERQSSSVTHL